MSLFGTFFGFAVYNGSDYAKSAYRQQASCKHCIAAFSLFCTDKCTGIRVAFNLNNNLFRFGGNKFNFVDESHLFIPNILIVAVFGFIFIIEINAGFSAPTQGCVVIIANGEHSLI